METGIQEKPKFTHGGPRPGSGRPRAGETTADRWLQFEDAILQAGGEFFDKKRLRKMLVRDPWRFIEKVMLPVLGMRRRSGVVGIKLGEGASATQFVLDLGAQDQPALPGSGDNAEEFGRILEHLGGLAGPAEGRE